jgi:hypothetical protein
LDVGTLEEEDVFAPDCIWLGLFLEAGAESDLEGDDRTGYFSLEELQSLFVFEEEPRVHEHL